MTSPDAPKWYEAVRKEIFSLDSNNTWILVELPKGKKALTCMWILKIKYRADGRIERYKARLVVRGCGQVAGIDYAEIFAHVVRLESLRVLLAIVCIEDLECDQMDIETAFLTLSCEKPCNLQGFTKEGEL